MVSADSIFGHSSFSFSFVSPRILVINWKFQKDIGFEGSFATEAMRSLARALFQLSSAVGYSTWNEQRVLFTFYLHIYSFIYYALQKNFAEGKRIVCPFYFNRQAKERKRLKQGFWSVG